jgi:CarD family transcriptional regulator
MELRIGQKVVYPGQGVCVVEEVRQKEIAGRTLQFYALRVAGDGSVIFVPTANADSVGLRPVISRIRCKQLIDGLSTDFDPVSADWKTRSRKFTDQLQSGDVFEAADVLKKLTFLSHEKKLSFREQTLMEKAKNLIISEVTNANSVEEGELRHEIDELVESACRKHLATQPRVMAATVH